MNRVVSAKALLFAEDGTVLVLKSSQTHPRHPGGADLPGGVAEDSEQVAEGLIREIHEETGLEVSIAELIEAYASTFYIEEINQTYIHHLFVATVHSKQVTLSWEHESSEWLQLENVTGLHDNYQRGVAYIIDHHLADEFMS